MAFLIAALPRSRTYWLSKFLSYGDWHCGHDEIQHMRSLDDVRTWWTQPNIGSCETAAAPFWRLLPQGIRVVTVRRDRRDVLASIVREVPDCDPVAMMRILEGLDRKLDQIEARMPGVLSAQFDDLAQEATCARVFEHCLDLPFDGKWWADWDKVKVSGNLTAQVRYCRAYGPQLEKLRRAAKQNMLAGLAGNHRVSLDGFTFQAEDYDSWLADAQPLFRQHMAQTGQDPEAAMMKNIPLGRRMAAQGSLQVMTARQNGRLFGYLIAMISQTLDEAGVLTAHLMLPFASPDAPGVGRKLAISTIEMLRANGVGPIFGRAGVRGDGPRLDAMFQRLGFIDDGSLYRLDI